MNFSSKLLFFAFFLMALSRVAAQDSNLVFFQLSDTIFKIGQTCQLPVDSVFAKNQIDLIPQCYSELNTFGATLVANPTMKIELAGNELPCNECGVDFNVRRIEAILFYLINKGASRRQISTEPIPSALKGTITGNQKLDFMTITIIEM